jgi:hypothetical protein
VCFLCNQHKPLLIALHWDQLMSQEDVAERHHSPDFTLGLISYT